MSKRVRVNNNKALVATTPNTNNSHDADLHSLVVSPLLADELDSTDDDRTHSRTGAAMSLTTGATPTAANAKGKGAATPTSSSNSDSKHVMLPAFLSKTYEIFCMPEFASICGWNASGDTIIVAQLEAFVARVLPRFFKHRNFPSFVRQLNLYGFHKTVLDSKRLEFQHPCFKRDRPDLLHYIKRKVSSGTSAAQQQQQQALVTSTAQNSRLEAHREISENLLREMKELRQRSDHMEKRLRELEIDNAIVRSDNVKLWKHLETAKDKQLIMQEKLKKIMWILFQIYRGKQGMPKLSGTDAANAISEDFANSSLLGPKEFREVLRYLAMDEPPLLPSSSSAVVVDSSASPSSRKRKFVEVPADGQLDQFGNDVYKFDPPSSVNNNSFDNSSTAMMLASMPSSPSLMAQSSPMQTAAPQSAAAAAGAPLSAPSSSALSIFSPTALGPRTEFANSDLNQLIANAMSSSLTNYDNALVAAAAAAAVSGAQQQQQQQQQLMSHAADATTTNSNNSSNNTNVLDLIDDELPLLSDSETYNFGEGEEQQVMKKLEDFETSLLDEYDVGCLDTLLQQLKSSSMGKPAADVSVIDPEEIFVGGAAASSPRNA